MLTKVTESLEQLEQHRADLKLRLDRFEAGDRDRKLTEAQVQSAALYMQRQLKDYNKLIGETKRQPAHRRRGNHLF